MKTQRLLIMRHGERLDTRDRNWKKTAARPYDTPITKHGEAAAYGVGQHRFPGKVSLTTMQPSNYRAWYSTAAPSTCVILQKLKGSVIA